MFTRFLNIFFSLLIILPVQSQLYHKKNFKVYLKKDGLSSNMINSIAQDIHGYIWIGSDKGLNRFDGSGFRQFYSDSLPESLPDDRIFKFKWINKETLGVLTNAGVHMINTKTLKMQNLLILEDSLSRIAGINRLFDMSVDKKENIFFVTSSGFYHFNRERLIFRYDHFSVKKAGNTRTFGWDIAKLDDQSLLLSTGEGLYIYNIEKKDLHPFSSKDDPFLHNTFTPGKNFRFIYSDEKYFSIKRVGQLEVALFDIQKRIKHVIQMPAGFDMDFAQLGSFYYLNDTLMATASSANGFNLIHYDKQSNSWMLDTTRYFRNDFCTSLLLDKNNRLWVATTNGLYKQNKPGVDIEQAQLPGEEPTFFQTISGLAVANKNVFVSTVAQGVYVFDIDSLNLSHHLTDALRPSYVVQLLKMNEDSLLGAHSATIINTKKMQITRLEQEKNTPLANKMKVLFKTAHNRVYYGKNLVDTIFYKDPWENTFSPLHLPALKKIGTPTQMAEDNDGNIWFGGHGLIRLNDQTKEFDQFIDSFPWIKKQGRGINSNIVFDNKGRMYFGVENNGLIIYDVKEKKFLHLTRQDGLPDNTIKVLFLHENKTLWIGTENGLASYELETGVISAFGNSDGMPVDANKCDALYYDKVDDQLYAAFTPYIVRFDPSKLKKNQTPPYFFIESIDITGKNSIHHPLKTVTVPYKNNSLIVNLTAINYEDAPQQLFAYRLLKNGAENWQELGQQNRIFFNDLAVGKHKLQIKVYIRNQSWPDQIKEVIFVVKPPFWKTFWFYLTMGLIIAGILFYFHKRRITQLTQKANVDKQLAQSEMKALHAQMNPHFVFNCLNSIREMILNNENEQASLYLSKFARLIRITLHQSAKQFVSLADTVDYLERYIEMEKIRSNHFTFTISVAKDLSTGDIMVPPMLIQPFIENAIWHGGSHKKQMDVHISFKKNGNELICIVEDNGIGIEESLKQKENVAREPSVGISNIKQRINLLNEKYNLQSTVFIQDKLTVTPKNGTGTLVTLHLPIKTNESLWTN